MWFPIQSREDICTGRLVITSSSAFDQVNALSYSAPPKWVKLIPGQDRSVPQLDAHFNTNVLLYLKWSDIGHAKSFKLWFTRIEIPIDSAPIQLLDSGSVMHNTIGTAPNDTLYYIHTEESQWGEAYHIQIGAVDSSGTISLSEIDSVRIPPSLGLTFDPRPDPAALPVITTLTWQSQGYSEFIIPVTDVLLYV